MDLSEKGYFILHGPDNRLLGRDEPTLPVAEAENILLIAEAGREKAQARLDSLSKISLNASHSGEYWDVYNKVRAYNQIIRVISIVIKPSEEDINRLLEP